MDKIFLKKLEIETVIGIWEWEKRLPQKVVFDLELSTDIKVAAASDLSLIHISEPTRQAESRMPSSA